MADREQERILKALRTDKLCKKAIRSLRERKFDQESLIEPLRWVLFWDRQPDRGMEWLAYQTRHDRRSLKRLPRRVEKFLEERRFFESAARRPLKTFQKQDLKLCNETSLINLSTVLSPDLLIGQPPATLEERSRLLKNALPDVPKYLRRCRVMWASDARDQLLRLRNFSLSYEEMANLLNAAAEAIGSDKQYTADALRKRCQRSRPSS